MSQRMTCPVCGSPECFALSSGYFCPKCGTEARFAAVDQETKP